jgi:hypothetical protein
MLRAGMTSCRPRAAACVLSACRAPIYLGSKEEVELIEKFKKEAGAA